MQIILTGIADVDMHLRDFDLGFLAGSCGGAPIDVIRQYIEQQQTPH